MRTDDIGTALAFAGWRKELGSMAWSDVKSLITASQVWLSWSMAMGSHSDSVLTGLSEPTDYQSINTTSREKEKERKVADAGTGCRN